MEPEGSSRSTGVRQPVSCEPCRRRKIKCSRTRQPCDACVRRRCAHSCVYVGASSISQDTSRSNNELLRRINNLEEILKNQTAANPMLSPPEESDPPLGHSPFTESPELRSPPSQQTSAGGLGTLTTSPNGNVRYEVRSSQWTSVLANTALSIDPSLAIHEENENLPGFPFTTSTVSSINELLFMLPPMQQCEYLKDIYFAVFSPLFHILHNPTFHAQYAQFEQDPLSVSTSWLSILFILLLLAVTALDETDPILRDLARGLDPCANIKILSKRYRNAAMKCLATQGVFWGKHNIQSLQALILLIYAMGHNQEHTWPLLGMTYNVAIALGCHIDPEVFHLDPIQSEERRRCWSGLMMQYTIQNTLLGNPDPLFRTYSDVRLPADVNDVDITMGVMYNNISGPTDMSYLLFKFQLYDLSAKICRQTFTTTEPSRSAIQALDQQISLAQESWDNRYVADSTIDILPTHHAVHLHILHAYAHQLLLLLHRPFFAQSILGLDIPNESQIRCIASAEALLDIHRILSETSDFRPYIWYTNGLGSFHAFHAAIVLAVALLMPIYKPQYQKFKRILDETQKRFDLKANRSKICEKASKVLRFMLTAPSPNQTSSLGNILNTPEHQRDDPLSSDQRRFFAERLQSQQWLAPMNISWSEWDDFMSQMPYIQSS